MTQGLAPFALGIPGARLNLHGLAAESIALDKQTALFDLTMMTARDGDRLCVALEYSTDLFKPSTIDRMAEGFRNLLEAIVADPGRRLADLALLSDSERHRLLGEWAEAPAIPHDDVAIHHRFERQVERSPDAVALVCGEESLTYRELNRLSNSLAHRLIELGVRPETVVGLYLERWPSRIGRSAGRPEGGRGLLAARPRPSRGATRGDAPGFRGDRAGDRGPSARPASGMPAAWSSPSMLSLESPAGVEPENPECASTARTSPTSSSPPAAPGGPRASWSLTAACSPPPPPGRTPTTCAGLRSDTSRPPASPSTSSPATGSAP